MLKYAFISVTWGEWEGKNISQSTNIAQISYVYLTSYVYDPTNTKSETRGEI